MSSALTDAARALREAALDPGVPNEALLSARRVAMRAASGASATALDAAAQLLLPVFGDTDPFAESCVAITLGAFVEMGLPPVRVYAAIEEACRAALVEAAPFRAALLAARDPDDDDDAGPRLETGEISLPMARARAIAETFPREASASYDALDSFCLPTIACLTRAPELRRQARLDATFAIEAAPFHRDAGKWLYQLLAGVTQEDWVVLHATERRGFVVRMTEINDNWCIPPLLAGAVMGRPDGLRGTPPSPSMLACLRGAGAGQASGYVEGQWELYTHRGIDADGALKPSTLENKIWNEGIPADIPRLDGTRVVVLGPQIVGRTWRASRSYDALGSDAAHVRTLTRSELDAWLSRCSAGGAIES